jgi:hypothetical protein
MNTPKISFEQAPHLTDEAANSFHDFLMEFAAAFEDQYALQIRRYWRDQEELICELQHQHAMQQQALSQDIDSDDCLF